MKCTLLFFGILICSFFRVAGQTTFQGIFRGLITHATLDTVLKNIRVDVSGGGIQGKVSRLTSSDGSFEIEFTTPIIKDSLKFEVEGYRIRSYTSKGSINRIFKVVPEPFFLLEGIIVDENQNPVSNAQIEINLKSKDKYFYANEDGRFLLNILENISTRTAFKIITVDKGRNTFIAYNPKNYLFKVRKHAKWGVKNNKLFITLPVNQNEITPRNIISPAEQLTINELKEIIEKRSHLQKRYFRAKQRVEELSKKLEAAQAQRRKGIKIDLKNLRKLEAEINAYKDKTAVLEKLLDKEQRQNILSTILFVVILFTIFLILFYRNRALIQAKRNTLKLQKYSDELIQQSDQLKARNTFVHLLLSELNHRVNNNLTSITSKLQIATRRIKDDSAKEFMQEVLNYVEQLQHIQNQLNFNATFGDKESITQKEIEFYFHEMAETIVNLQLEAEQKPELIIEVKVATLKNEKLRLLGYVVFELINNSCKYAFPEDCIPSNPYIFIYLEQVDKHLKLSLGNNGVGLPKELFDEQETFRLDRIKSSKGLKIIDHLTQIDQGNFHISLNPTQDKAFTGAKFECTFKL